MLTKKVMIIDVATNGAWGKPWAIASIVFNKNGGVDHKFIANVGCESEELTNDYSVQHAKRLGMKATVKDSKEALIKFINFYMMHRSQVTVLTYMGYISEANIFRCAVDMDLLKTNEAPYPLLDIASHLDAIGYASTSVDEYNEIYDTLDAYENDLKGMHPHHPLYNCYAIFACYEHIKHTLGEALNT